MITSPNKHGTQRERILSYMLDNLNKKTPCYYFANNMGIMRYWARLHELQKEWRPIRNEINFKWKQKHSTRTLEIISSHLINDK